MKAKTLTLGRGLPTTWTTAATGDATSSESASGPACSPPLIRRAIESTDLRTLIADGGLEVCLVKSAPTSPATSPVGQEGTPAPKKAGGT